MSKFLTKYRRFNQRPRHKKGIAEIIAALLLILVAVAAAAVVYTYVLNFVGNVSQVNSGSTSAISVEYFCVSASTNCTVVSGLGTSYYIVVRNAGLSSIQINSTKEPALYFSDVTTQKAISMQCNAPVASVPPQGTYVCFSILNNSLGVSAGDTIALKVVNPDGGTSVSNAKSLI
jgi:flagellin-like protein